jgi:hypothetical protein
MHGLAYEALSHLDNPFISPARIEVILALSEPAETIAEPVAAEPVAAETLPPRPPALDERRVGRRVGWRTRIRRSF